MHRGMIFIGLIAALVLGGCVNSLQEEAAEPQQGGGVQGQGKGLILIGRGGAGRTAAPGETEQAGMSFAVTVASEQEAKTVTFGPEGGSIELDPGTYAITVRARNSGGRLRGMADERLSMGPGLSHRVLIRSAVGIRNYTELKNALEAAPGSAEAAMLDTDLTRENLLVVENAISFGSTGIALAPWRRFTLITDADGPAAITESGNSLNDAWFDIPGGASLTLGAADMKGTLILNGAGISGGSKPLLNVSGGDLVMQKGAVLTGRHIASANNGGAVVIQSGRFIMNGGAITDCKSLDASAGYGGGVFMYGGIFTMYGGEISGCEALYGGGGVCLDSKGAESPVFTLLGGAVKENSVTANSGKGGGVYAGSGMGGSPGGGAFFNMLGGEISGCEAVNGGGGVYLDRANGDSSFFMAGGTISQNKAAGSNGSGGGIYAGGVTYSIHFIMDGGEISNNQAQHYGGGVWLPFGGIEFVRNGGSISGNTAGAFQDLYPFEPGSWTELSAAVSAVPAGMTAEMTLLPSAVPNAWKAVSSITVDNGKEIRLIPAGAITIERGGHTGPFFTVSGISNSFSTTLALGETGMGGTLIFDGGGAAVPGVTGSLVKAQSCGSLEMYDRVSLQNNHIGADNGGGVSVDGADAYFVLYGGTISGCKAYNGGGVSVTNRAVFEMGGDAENSGGVISGNAAANNCGGVYVVRTSSSAPGGFTKTSGIINGNDAGSSEKNTAAAQGQAAFYREGTINKYRNTTLGSNDGINTGSAGGWAP